MGEESAPQNPVPSSEDEMRSLFAEKEAAKLAEQKRLSRKTTRIVVGGVLLVLLGILCTPLDWNPRDPSEGPNSELAAKAAQIQAQLSGGRAGEAPPASNGTVEGDALRSDALFALDLIRYLQPENQGHQEKKAPAPVPAAK